MSTAAWLRALVVALPDEARGRWDADRNVVYADGDREEVAVVRTFRGLAGRDAIAAHLAALDPPVVLALADLMTACAAYAAAMENVEPSRDSLIRRGRALGMAMAEIMRTYAALDAALNREPQT